MWNKITILALKHRFLLEIHVFSTYAHLSVQMFMSIDWIKVPGPTANQCVWVVCEVAMALSSFCLFRQALRLNILFFFEVFVPFYPLISNLFTTDPKRLSDTCKLLFLLRPTLNIVDKLYLKLIYFYNYILSLFKHFYFYELCTIFNML